MENNLQIDSSMQRQRALVEFHGRHFGFYFSFGPTDAIRTRLYASHGIGSIAFNQQTDKTLK